MYLLFMNALPVHYLLTWHNFDSFFGLRNTNHTVFVLSRKNPHLFYSKQNSKMFKIVLHQELTYQVNLSHDRSPLKQVPNMFWISSNLSFKKSLTWVVFVKGVFINLYLCWLKYEVYSCFPYFRQQLSTLVNIKNL